MKVEISRASNPRIVEVTGDTVLINTVDDAMQIMIDCCYGHQAEKAILYQENICSDFFDLKTKLAGEILQKFMQYHFDIVIVGDFSVYTSNSLKDFIYESNKSNKINFVANRDQAISCLNKVSN